MYQYIITDNKKNSDSIVKFPLFTKSTVSKINTLLPGIADIHWQEGIRQRDFRWVNMIYKLAGKKDVIIHAISEENCEANHKQQLTARRKKYLM